MRTATPQSPVPIIGIIGSVGSGKSTVAQMFADWGGVIVSGDEIGHRVVEQSRPIRQRLARAFGTDILRADSIDRRLVAERAFANPASTLKLNRIVHPRLVRTLRQEIQHARKRHGARAVVVDAALLVEWGRGHIPWDCLVGVWAPAETRLRRLRSRGLTPAQARRIAQSQMPWSRKCAFCDVIVKNDSSLTILRRRARFCWDNMLLSVDSEPR